MRLALAWLIPVAASAAIAEPPAAAAADLGIYDGKYPTEPVDGMSFFADPRVRAAAEAAGASAAIRAWIFERPGQRTPIALRGNWLVSWGCEAHNCNDHDWTIFIDRTGTSVQICYHSAETMHDRSRWFRTGRPPELRPDASCPS